MSKNEIVNNEHVAQLLAEAEALTVPKQAKVEKADVAEPDCTDVEATDEDSNEIVEDLTKFQLIKGFAKKHRAKLIAVGSAVAMVVTILAVTAGRPVEDDLETDGDETTDVDDES